MIVLFTDFGREGPYLGQMVAVLKRAAPEVPVIDLVADAPAHDPRSSAYLLAAYATGFAAGTVFLCIVDPGVGSTRAAGVLDLDGRLFVGPDNGLFEIVERRAAKPGIWKDILWRPADLSESFHGRDLFAPVAARLARGMPVELKQRRRLAAAWHRWPDDLPAVIYVDAFGNLVSGLRAGPIPATAILSAGPHRIRSARTFSDVSPGIAFWYKNANGLVEIAVNSGRADQILCLKAGDDIAVEQV